MHLLIVLTDCAYWMYLLVVLTYITYCTYLLYILYIQQQYLVILLTEYTYRLYSLPTLTDCTVLILHTYCSSVKENQHKVVYAKLFLLTNRPTEGHYYI